MMVIWYARSAAELDPILGPYYIADETGIIIAEGLRQVDAEAIVASHNPPPALPAPDLSSVDDFIRSGKKIYAIQEYRRRVEGATLDEARLYVEKRSFGMSREDIPTYAQLEEELRQYKELAGQYPSILIEIEELAWDAQGKMASVFPADNLPRDLRNYRRIVERIKDYKESRNAPTHTAAGSSTD